MPTPSFILPSAPVYEEGTLYGLELYGSNFVPSPMSFTRATTATRVNADGLVELVPYNIVQYSEQFDNAVWTKTNAGTGVLPLVVANQGTAPDGTLTADRIQLNRGSGGTASDSSVVRQQITVANNATTTISIYLKSFDGNNYQIVFSNSGVVVSQKITVTNQWQRFLLTGVSAGALANIEIQLREGVFAITGQSVTADLLVWGAQLVEGTEALPYLKTETRLNRPRVDFSLPGCPNLLLEPQRTNLALYSSSFDSATWVKVASSVTANQIASPSGVQDADKLTENSANEIHGLNNLNLYPSITTATASLFFKKGTRKFFSIKLQIGGNSYTQVYDSESVTTTSNSSNGLTSVSSTIVDFGNGWVRATLTGTNPSGAGNTYIIYCLSDSGTPTFNPVNFNPTYQGTGTDYGYLWGAQLEVGNYATSYIPTTATSVTRNLETVVKTGISALIGQTEGVFYAEINGFLGDNTSRDISIYSTSFGAYNNYLRIQLRNITNLVRFTIIANGSSIRDFSTTVVQNNFNKIAVKYSQSGYSFWLNGVKVGDGVNACDFQLLDIFRTSSVDGSGPFNGNIKTISLWKTALTDDQLEALTGLGFNTYAEMASYYNYTLQ